MTIVLSWWMLLPAVMLLLAAWAFYEGEHESGMFGGMFHAMVGLALLVGTVLFMLGRWLA